MPKCARYIAIAAGITALAIPAGWLAIQQTDAFAVASIHVRNSEEIRSHLGDIQDVDLPLLGYNIHVVGARGNANFNLKVKGSLVTGTVYVELARRGTWHPVLSRLVMQDGTTINILP